MLHVLLLDPGRIGNLDLCQCRHRCPRDPLRLLLAMDPGGCGPGRGHRPLGRGCSAVDRSGAQWPPISRRGCNAALARTSFLLHGLPARATEGRRHARTFTFLGDGRSRRRTQVALAHGLFRFSGACGLASGLRAPASCSLRQPVSAAAASCLLRVACLHARRPRWAWPPAARCWPRPIAS